MVYMHNSICTCTPHRVAEDALCSVRFPVITRNPSTTLQAEAATNDVYSRDQHVCKQEGSHTAQDSIRDRGYGSSKLPQLEHSYTVTLQVPYNICSGHCCSRLGCHGARSSRARSARSGSTGCTACNGNDTVVLREGSVGRA